MRAGGSATIDFAQEHRDSVDEIETGARLACQDSRALPAFLWDFTKDVVTPLGFIEKQ